MKVWIPLFAVALALSPLTVVHPVRVAGHSMEPLLRDRSVHIGLRAWCAGKPRAGEIWLIDGPDGPVVKRVIGLPGDRLEQRQGELVLNGARLSEPYLTQFDLGDMGLWEAGDGYLLVGDNRRESLDSRMWGPLPRAAFRARLVGFPDR